MGAPFSIDGGNIPWYPSGSVDMALQEDVNGFK
jgi:hypothetical protein